MLILKLFLYSICALRIVNLFENYLTSFHKQVRWCEDEIVGFAVVTIQLYFKQLLLNFVVELLVTN